MSRIHGLWLSCLLISVLSYGQSGTEYKKDPAIGVHFFLNDYKSAAKVRASSMNSVLINKQFGKVKEMTAGLALNYLKGLNNHLDFSVTGAGSFVSYELRNNPGSAKDRFLLEVDASVIGKLMSDKYWLSPYVQTGVGGLIYGVYYGAFIPAGVGLQVNFYDEAFLLMNAQYRIPITETANYHFYYSLGIAGNIGKKKDATSLKSKPSLPLVSR
jgi:OOP family OmpA-OmpF porin